MAVFLINICKFDGCGITFPSLSDLIQHIEDTHIDYDPKVVEQKELAQPTSLPLSYVLRFVAEGARKEGSYMPSHGTGSDLKRKIAIKHHSYSMSSSNRSNTPTGSEMDDEEMIVSESDDSNDSWTTEEFSSEFIMRYGSRHSGTGNVGSPGNEKPFACPVPGCKKRYKNVNGIKYHSKNGHKKDGKVKKGFKCPCGKSYKTSQGLKNHAHTAHNSPPESVMVGQHGGANGTGGSHIIMVRSTSPSQRSIGSLSPSSISNISSSASSCHSGSSCGANNNCGSSCSNSGSSGISGVVSGGAGQAGSTTSSGNTSVTPPQQQFNTTANTNQINIAPAHSQQTPTPTSASASVPPQQYMPLYLCQNLSAVEQNSNSGKGGGGVQKQPPLLQHQQKQQLQLKQQQQQHHQQLQTGQTIQIAKLQHAKQIVLTQQQHHNQHQQQQLHQQLQATQPTTPANKITVPSLVNLGILTPATSPTKTSLNHTQHAQAQQLQSQNLVTMLQQQKIQNSNNNKATIKNNKMTTHLAEPSASQQQQQLTYLVQPHQQVHQLQSTQQPQQPPLQPISVQKTTTIAVSAQQLVALANLSKQNNCGNGKSGSNAGNSSCNGQSKSDSSIISNAINHAIKSNIIAVVATGSSSAVGSTVAIVDADAVAGVINDET